MSPAGALGRATVPVDRPEAMLRRLTLLLAITLAIASCGSDGVDDTDREVDAYVAVIRALTADEPGGSPPDTEVDQPDLVVYAGALDDEQSISLEVQAAVVEQLEDVATVRFVDERDEAVDDAEEGAPVLEDGVLLLLGPVPSGSAPSVDAERYIDVDDTTRARVDLQRANDGWDVVGVDAIGS